MTHITVMISMAMTMIYAGSHEDLKVLFAVGLLMYAAGIFLGNMIEKRTNNRIKAFEKEIEELKKNSIN